MAKRQWSSLKTRNLLIFALVAQAIIYWAWRRDAFHIRASAPRDIGDMDEGAYGEAPPDIKAKISGYVQEVTWDPEFPQATCKLTKSFDRRHSEPILIRNAVDWPALKLWNLTWLAHQDIEVDAWAAPNMKFYYINENLLHREMKRDSTRSLPVAHKLMKAQEAVARMQRKSDHSPIHFRDTERYYLRFEVTDSMRESIGPDSGAMSCFSNKDFQGDEGLGHFLAKHQSEPIRAWVSPKGAISPLHFDHSPSFLIQVHGVKRMLLYNPLDRLFVYPYPDDHLLRRRGQVDPTAPDYVKFPRYESISGKLAILNPGDILVFPAGAPHYTDTLESSLSLVLRWN